LFHGERECADTAVQPQPNAGFFDDGWNDAQPLPACHAAVICERTASRRTRRHRKNRSNLNQIVIALTMTVNFVSKSGRAISFKLYRGFAAENCRQFYLVVPAFILFCVLHLYVDRAAGDLAYGPLAGLKRGGPREVEIAQSDDTRYSSRHPAGSCGPALALAIRRGAT
jgi:hypothetical protein